MQYLVSSPGSDNANLQVKVYKMSANTIRSEDDLRSGDDPLLMTCRIDGVMLFCRTTFEYQRQRRNPFAWDKTFRMTLEMSVEGDWALPSGEAVVSFKETRDGEPGPWKVAKKVHEL
jgi:hypothetical protein